MYADSAEASSSARLDFGCYCRTITAVLLTNIIEYYVLKYINEDKQAQPDHIDKMPVPGSSLKSEVIRRGKMFFGSSEHNDQKNNRTHTDVETVEAGQHEEC